MRRIGILSDTHGHLPDAVSNFFSDVDEIWHAGDIGNIEVIESLEKIGPVKGVFGNIDGQDIRNRFSKELVFNIEQTKVCITHIGGYFGKYNQEAVTLIKENKPDLLICGHSHILKIQYDKDNELLFINPGAAGKFGLHQQITMVRFSIENDQFKDMDVYNIPKTY